MFFHKEMEKLNRAGCVQNFTDSEDDPDYSDSGYSAESVADTQNFDEFCNCDTGSDSDIMQWSYVSPRFQPQKSLCKKAMHRYRAAYRDLLF
jgi:hypothetical protein